MTSFVHPTAIVEPGCQVGADCRVHPYAIVNRGAVLGDRVEVHPFAVVGGDSQDLKFDRSVPSGVRIGAGTRIREHATIHRATHRDTFTEVGENCLLMAGSHVAHDCVVGREVVLANAVMLAGHVAVGDHAILGGGCGIHQFVRIGEGAIIGGLARITKDVPPFTLVAERDEMAGLNVIGLRRRGVPPTTVRELKEALRLVYAGGKVRDAAGSALASGAFSAPESRRFLEFFLSGQRGFARLRRSAGEADGDTADAATA